MDIDQLFNVQGVSSRSLVQCTHDQGLIFVVEISGLL